MKFLIGYQNVKKSIYKIGNTMVNFPHRIEGPTLDTLLEKANELENAALRDLVLSRLRDVNERIQQIAHWPAHEIEGEISWLKKTFLSKKFLDDFKSNNNSEFENNNNSEPDEKLKDEKERVRRILSSAKLILGMRIPFNTNIKVRPTSVSIGTIISTLRNIEEYIHQKNYEAALKYLSTFRFDTEDEAVIKKLYFLLHHLLSHLNQTQFADMAGFIDYLLTHSSTLPWQQCKLAEGIAKMYISYTAKTTLSGGLDQLFDQFKTAMHFYAKAILITEHYLPKKVNKIHQSASQLLMQFIRHHFIDTKKILDNLNNVGNSEEFRKVLLQIQTLKNFCHQREAYINLKKLYETSLKIVQRELNRTSVSGHNDKVAYENFSGQIHKCIKEVNEVLSGRLVPEPLFVTEKYRLALKKFRENIEKEFHQNSKWIKGEADVEQFQKSVSRQFHDLLRIIFKDSFSLFNHLSFDFCIMGSVGKGEPSPFSDIEGMILIKKEKDLSDITLLFKLLQLQIISIGETESPYIFTCAREKPGLHIDADIATQRLIKTPLEMASKQGAKTSGVEKEFLVNSEENLILHAISFYGTDSQLFSDYKKELHKQLPEGQRHRRALQRIIQRLEGLKKTWPSPLKIPTVVDVKTQFREPLNHLLSDFGLYFGMETSNTLEIIDLLMVKNFFTEESGQLIKKAVESIYMIRVGLHFKYERQKETALLADIPAKQRDPNNNINASNETIVLLNEETSALNQAYWLVLMPLYYKLGQITKDGNLLDDQRNINFLDIFFEQTNFDLNESAIAALVSFLVNTKASMEKHFEYYKKITDRFEIETLRGAYVENFRALASDQINTLNKLYLHPTRSASRQSEVQMRQNFEELLRKVTTDKEETSAEGFSVCIESPVLNKPGIPNNFFLRAEMINVILDSEGKIKPNYKHTEKTTTFCLDFKQVPLNSIQYPFHPGKEQAVTRLMMRLFGHGVLMSDLIKFSVKHASNNNSSEYFVFVSEVIEGIDLAHASAEQLKKVDPKQLSELILSAPLILPGNRVEENIILKPSKNEAGEDIYQLVTINNGISWAKAIALQNNNTSKIKINFSDVLFFKFPDLMLHPDATREFLLLKPELILENWFLDLRAWNERQRFHFPELDNWSDESSPLCFFNKGIGVQLLAQFERLQTNLRSRESTKTGNLANSIPADEILKTIISINRDIIENVGEHIYISYQNMRNLSVEPKEKIARIRRGTTLEAPLNVAKDSIKFARPEEILNEIADLHAHYNQVHGFYYIEGNRIAKLEKGFEQKNNEPPNLQLQAQILHGLLLLQNTPDDESKMVKFEKLNFSHCYALTDKILKQFLEKSGDVLKYLNLNFCHQITDKSLLKIEKLCPKLEELHMQNCNIKKFGSPPGGLNRVLRGKSLSFLWLKTLDITNNDHLEDIGFIAPKLENFKYDPLNPNLRPVYIDIPEATHSKAKEPPEKKNDKTSVAKSTQDYQGLSRSDLTAIMDSWKDKLKKLNPNILQSIQIFADKNKNNNNNNAVIEYIKNLVPRPMRETAYILLESQGAPGHTEDEYLHTFYQYLLNVSLTLSDHNPGNVSFTLSDHNPERENASFKQLRSLLATRFLFIADNFDYPLYINNLNSKLEASENQIQENVEELGQSIESILSYIQQAAANIDKLEGKKAISVIGNTDVGKSTTINYLLGCKMSKSNNNLIDQIVAENALAKIGLDDKSETLIPESFPIEDLFLCDMPGFLDTNGPEYSIANAVNIRKLLTKAKSNGLLFLVTYHSIVGLKAVIFRNSIRTLINFFGSSKNLNENTNSILIGVNRVPVDINFNNLRKKIQDLAKEENWILNDPFEQIIQINPLDRSGEKDQIIKKIKALSPINNPGMLRTALDEKDELLIAKITKKISKNIQTYLEQWKIDEVIKEYKKLNSLRCIQHPSVENEIVELKTNILRQLQEKKTSMLADAQLDEPLKRLKTNYQMSKLEACGALDELFMPEQKAISKQVDEFKETLKEIEYNMQSKVNARIGEDLSLQIQALTYHLQDLLKNQRSSLANIDIIESRELESLSKQFKLGVIGNLQFLFEQIEKEMKLRPYKYYFKDQVRLKDLKQIKESEIRDVILSNHKQARLLESQANFKLAYQSLQADIREAVQKHYKSLRDKTPTLDHLEILTSFGFDPEQIKKLSLARKELKALLDPVQIGFYEENLKALLNSIYKEANLVNKKNHIEEISQLVKAFFAKDIIIENELKKLNGLLERLYKLDEITAYPEALQLITSVLIEQPSQKLHEILLVTGDSGNMDVQYLTKLDSLFNKVKLAYLLPACFKREKVEAILGDLNQTVMKKEQIRRYVEVQNFIIVLTSFEELKVLVKSYTMDNPRKVLEALSNPSNILRCLNNLQKEIPSLATACNKWVDLLKAIQLQGQRYYFPQDNKLESIKSEYEVILKKFFQALTILSQLLILKSQINLAIQNLNNEAQTIVKNNPATIVKNGIASTSGFSSALIEKFEQLVKELEGLSTEALNQGLLEEKSELPRLKEVLNETENHIKNFQKATLQEANASNVKSIVQDIANACHYKTYLTILPTIRNMLAILSKEENLKSYHKIIKLLRISIDAFQNPTDLENYLKAKDYSNVVKTYETLEKLQEALKDYMRVDISTTQTTIILHIKCLFKDAQSEINCDFASEKYLDLSQTKHFLNILLAGGNYPPFLDTLLQEGCSREFLHEVARFKREELITQFPTSDSMSLTYDHREATLGDLAKKLIKHQAIATQLSIQKDFELMMDLLFGKISSGLLIDKLGSKVREFDSKDSFINASAKEILQTFPEFEHFNIQDWNKKANGIDFKKALEGLECIPTPAPDFKDKLNKAYSIFKENYDYFVEQIIQRKFISLENINQAKKLSKELTPHAMTLSLHMDKTCELLARIFAQWTYQSASKETRSVNSNSTPVLIKESLLQPHSTQVLSILRLIGIDNPKEMENHLDQIKTGEGKSISLGVTAILLGLLGYEVKATCYSSYLSNRDEKAFSKLFQDFGVKYKISYSTIDNLMDNIIGTALPDFRILIHELLKGGNDLKQRVAHLFSSDNLQNLKKSLLLLDEVDVFFGPDFYGSSYSPVFTLQSAGTQELIRHIWKNKASLRHITTNQELKEIMSMPYTKSILSEYPNVATLLEKEILKMISALVFFPDEKKPIKEYKVIDDQIGDVDRAGNLYFSFHSYETTFAYLYHREQKEIKSDTYLIHHLSIPFTCAQLLYSEMPKFFSLKLGLTATLNELSTEENKILDQYEFTQRSFIPSTFKKEKLKIYKTIVKTEMDQYFTAIKVHMENELRENRACLVVFKDTNHLKKFTEFLKLHKYLSGITTPEILNEEVPDDEKAAVVSRAIHQGKATLMTRRFGRGIDFICRDEALKASGGVHIILTFNPETRTEEIQIYGRTCRQNDPGSVHKILLVSDLYENGHVAHNVIGKAMLDQAQALSSHSPVDSSNNNSIDDSREFLLNKKIEKDSEPSQQDDYTFDNYLNEQRQEKYNKQFADVYKTLEKNAKSHQSSIRLSEAIRDGDVQTALDLLRKFNS